MLIDDTLIKSLPGVDFDFLTGIEHLKRNDYQSALQSFLTACRTTQTDAPYRHKYMAFVGLCKTFLSDKSGIAICRHMAKQEKNDGDVFFALAIAELQAGNRLQAINALKIGLRANAYHLNLKRLYRATDTRRRPTIKQLHRNHPLNIVLGKMSYKVRSSRSQQKKSLQLQAA